MAANTGAGIGGSKIRNAKLVLLGDVGKSNLVLRFVKGQLVEFQTLAVNDETVKFKIWDTSGQERYHSLAPMYYRGAAAAIVVYYITNLDRDLVVEPMSTTSSTQPSRPYIRSSPSASSENIRARNSGSSSRSAAPPPAAPQAGAANPLRFDARTIHFSVNAWVLLVVGLGMLPILPKHLADRACKLSLLGTILSSGYSLYSTYGKPRELNMPAIQSWLQSVLGAKDLMFSLLLVTSQLHLKIAALPVFCWALYHVARFLRRNFSRSSFYRGYLEEPCLWVETNNTTLSLLSSNAELALGFLLIISLFSWRRNFMQTFMYWNVLMMMYRTPVTSSYHQSAWAKIGRTVNLYINRFRGIL
ncbi:hypothetical protein ZWY2020_059023 [Hordeum vulgare]|nr:hypothetical protein ZWY2020_059023 [Hordeum vulgare]